MDRVGPYKSFKSEEEEEEGAKNYTSFSSGLSQGVARTPPVPEHSAVSSHSYESFEERGKEREEERAEGSRYTSLSPPPSAAGFLRPIPNVDTVNKSVVAREKTQQSILERFKGYTELGSDVDEPVESTRGNSSLSSPSLERGNSSESRPAVKPLDFREFESGFDLEFHRLMDVVKADTSLYAEHNIFLRLRKLVQDFQHAAQTYGKIIISEKHVPFENKTIRPVEEIGGIAGGEKFIAGDIFFRFPLDVFQLYGSEELASKEANHQLKGLAPLFNLSIPSLNLPLLTVIKYRGYKLVAMSVLPIQGEASLCYGSCDGGKNVEVQAQELIESVGKALNLAEHPVRFSGKSKIAWVHTPCDLEAHRVMVDGDPRHYLVDFARLFPPQPPYQKLCALIAEVRKGLALYDGQHAAVEAELFDRPIHPSLLKGSHLVHLLRPELVKGFHKPLSSDAFTRFAAPGYPQFNDDVVEATRFLLYSVIPAVTEKIEHALENNEPERKGRTPGSLVMEMLHQAGVNARFLGLVFDRASSLALKQVLLMEGAARVIKAMVRASMRNVHSQVRTAVVSPYIDATQKTLNQVFGRTTCTRVPNDVHSEKCTSTSQKCHCKCRPQSARFSCSTCKRDWMHLYDLPTVESTLADRVRRLSGAIQSDELLEECVRRRFWCLRLGVFLQERFFFSSFAIHTALEDLAKAQQRNACTCCNCLWKRAVCPRELFMRTQEMCGIVMSPVTQEEILAYTRVEKESDALVVPFCLAPLEDRLALNQDGPDTTTSKGSFFSCEENLFSDASRTVATDTVQVSTCFDLMEPFGDGDIVQVEGTVELLPIMDFAHGAEAQVRAAKNFGKGNVREAKRLAGIAKQALEAGLSRSPRDVKLLCNLASLTEFCASALGEGSSLQAFEMHLNTIVLDRKHARSWYMAGTQLYRRFLAMGSRVPAGDEFMDKVEKHLGGLPEFKLDDTIRLKKKTDQELTVKALRFVDCFMRNALACNPRYVNCIKDYANFNLHSLNRASVAMDLFKLALQVDPSHERTLQNLARLQLERGLWEEAKLTVEQSIKFFPTNPVSELEYAMLSLALLDLLDGEDPRFSKKAYSKKKQERILSRSRSSTNSWSSTSTSSSANSSLRLSLDSAASIVRSQSSPTESDGEQPSTTSKRLEYINQALVTLNKSINLLNGKGQTSREQGYADFRYFENDDMDVHASISLRASKLFNKIARYLFSYWERHTKKMIAGEEVEQGEHNRALLEALVETCWVAFRWSSHVIQADRLFTAFDGEKNEFLQHPQFSASKKAMQVNRFLHLKKQLVQNETSYARALAQHAAPELEIETQPADFNEFKELMKKYKGHGFEVKEDFSTGVVRDKLRQALQILSRAVRFDRREHTAAEFALMRVVSFLDENGGLSLV